MVQGVKDLVLAKFTAAVRIQSLDSELAYAAGAAKIRKKKTKQTHTPKPKKNPTKMSGNQEECLPLGKGTLAPATLWVVSFVEGTLSSSVTRAGLCCY